MPLVRLPLKNLGTGPAKDIQVTWSLDVQEIIFTLHDTDALGSREVWNEQDKGVVSIEAAKVKTFHSLPGQLADRIPFLEVGGAGETLTLPALYLEFVAMYVAAIVASADRDVPDFGLDRLGSATLTLRYRDVGKFAYEKIFRIRPKLTAYSSGGALNGKDVVAQGEIAVEEA